MNALGGGGATPLHCAAGTVDVAIVKILLDWHADVTVADMGERLALDWAAESGKVDIERVLVRHGSDVGANEQIEVTALQMAKGNKEADEMDVRVLLDSLALERQKRVPMIQPLKDGIESRDENGLTPLPNAAIHGELSTVRELLERGADPEARGPFHLNSLHIEVEGRLAAVRESILAGGARIEAVWERPTALHLAATHGHTETVTALLVGGAQIEAVWAGYTALHVATNDGYKETVNALLAAGAQTETLVNGKTALHIAVERGHSVSQGAPGCRCTSRNEVETTDGAAPGR